MLKTVKTAAVAAALLLTAAVGMPTVANASNWQLVSCDYEPGTGYVGTYRSAWGTGGYVKRVVFQNYCPYSI